MAGLVLGLAALAALTIWGSAIALDTTARVRTFNSISSRWGKVFTRLSNEDAALTAFVANGGIEYRRTRLLATIDSAEPDLAWLERYGGPGEAQQVRMLRPAYSNYNNSVRAVAEPGGRGLGTSGMVELAALDFGQVRELVVANVERKQLELVKYLNLVDRHNMTLRWVMVGVVQVDALFCVLSAVILIGYQRRAEREAACNRHKALHDGLTGLANRHLLSERIEEALDQSRVNTGVTGLLLIDLDRFKEVNDTLGHHCGDILLQRVAERLAEISRQNDTVARLGGDEFAVLLPAVESSADLLAVARRVRNEIRQQIVLDGHPVEVGASVGVAVFPTDSDNAEDLLRHADAAMYVAKRGALGVSVFGVDDEWRVSEMQLVLDFDLRE